jgi:hypothetical protein
MVDEYPKPLGTVALVPQWLVASVGLMPPPPPALPKRKSTLCQPSPAGPWPNVEVGVPVLALATLVEVFSVRPAVLNVLVMVLKLVFWSRVTPSTWTRTLSSKSSAKAKVPSASKSWPV